MIACSFFISKWKLLREKQQARPTSITILTSLFWIAEGSYSFLRYVIAIEWFPLLGSSFFFSIFMFVCEILENSILMLDAFGAMLCIVLLLLNVISFLLFFSLAGYIKPIWFDSVHSFSDVWLQKSIFTNLEEPSLPFGSVKLRKIELEEWKKKFKIRCKSR